MDKSVIAAVPVDEQSIEIFATQKAEEIVEIDMTTPEYTADTCTMASDNVASHAMSDTATQPTHMKVGV